ncbi:transcriptional regulator, MerR family [Pseudomonas sp. NFIX51]|uniref:MerR family transcriptional regulator n=1 Tax=unclassified Pseudomonas TaxID=196821 RepID=UPI0008AA9D5C|nr:MULTISPECIES: MerR family transcriptional regulator [unclassified Pseudomonas]SEL21053.1 DNA-binding transcriptional regulator, MerR family [Pseudomonas sp. NFACC41-3]SMH53314.1 transcriptional regulator, MerR family [Pseudomonas sp. NFIX51]
MNDSRLDPDAPASESDGTHEQGWLPIREVTRQTGVNAVTLRAWERRYGLIVPQRTAKGHRLFSNEHVQRILKILTWLDRGVAVSQVKHLLDAEPAPSEPAHNDWHLQRQRLVQAISQLAERQVDESFNQVMALYPPRTLCEHLLLPLLDELEQRWQGRFGMQMERVFFHSWLRSKFAVRVYHNNRQLQGAPLLLINHSDLPLEPHLWLCAWLISNADCPVEVFDWPLPPGELALAAEHLKARGVLLYSSQSINLRQLPRLLGGLDCPVLIVGPAVSIHHAELAICTTEIANLHLAADPLSAHQALIGLRLL